MKMIKEDSTEPRLEKIRRKHELSRKGLIRCTRCPYHKYENKKRKPLAHLTRKDIFENGHNWFGR